MIGTFQNIQSFTSGNVLTVKDWYGKTLATVDRSGFKDFDQTVLKELIAAWTAFWSQGTTSASAFISAKDIKSKSKEDSLPKKK
jgi:hypothetical protein